jgi:cell division septation protein DedD
MATILAEGLRSHGFDAFVAPGPSEKIFRVLIGPLPDPESFRQAKAAVDAIELSTFARKYEK